MDTNRIYLGRLQPGMIEARWCVDSETGIECLVDLYTHEIIAKRIKGKIVDPSTIVSSEEEPQC